MTRHLVDANGALVMAGDILPDGFGATFTVASVDAASGSVTVIEAGGDLRTYPADAFGLEAGV